MMQNTIQFVASNIQNAVEQELANWKNENKIQRLWEGDALLWTNSDESQWLGWLEEAVRELSDVARIEKLATEIKSEHFEHLVVLGMGGSSLCPAMMAKTFGRIENYPQLHVLDSTDPQQISHLEDSLDLKKTLFIVSSKSGSTLEPNIFKQYFYTRLQTVLKKSDVGDRFIAITDPGSKLEAIAKKDQFRAIFHGIPSIGGRYSALSNFGMVPAGLMGVPVRDFLFYAEQMAKACSLATPQDNPGVLLGVILGVCQRLGKDKVTLIVSSDVQALGAWLEQLLAESTGKEGKGLIPIDQEPLGDPQSYGSDRLFVYIRLEDAADDKEDHAMMALEQAGHVVVRLNLANKQQLGGELFRWEIATAVAGSIIGINPFNQPDVEESKVLAVQLMTEYQKTGKIESPNLICSRDEIKLLADDINEEEIRDLLTKDLSSNKQTHEPSIEAVLLAHFSRVKPGDYVNLSAFIEMSDQHTELLQQSRILIRDKMKIATCLGFGPRFLHSTGQDYKGGPNTGVFLQITAEHAKDIPIPGLDYTFGLVIDAQAEGDLNTLVKRKRRVLCVHLGKNVAQDLQKLYEYIEVALGENIKNKSPGSNHGTK